MRNGSETEIANLLGDLERQEALVAERLPLASRFEAAVDRTMAAARDLTDLSETFVSNALALSLAVIADLYKPKEAASEEASPLDLLDQLAEKRHLQSAEDVRTTPGGIADRTGGKQVSHRFGSGLKLSQIQTDYLSYVETISRRVKGVTDPTRRRQAEEYLETIRSAIGTDAPDGGLVGSRSRLLAIAAQSDILAADRRAIGGERKGCRSGLLKDAQASSAAAAYRGEIAVTWGLRGPHRCPRQPRWEHRAMSYGLSSSARLVRPLEEVTLASREAFRRRSRRRRRRRRHPRPASTRSRLSRVSRRVEAPSDLGD